MTLNGAIAELAILHEHPMMPDIFKSAIQKIIETVSECEEPSAQPEPSQIARDIATIIENEQDMRVMLQPEQRWIPCSDCERKCDKWENSKT